MEDNDGGATIPLGERLYDSCSDSLSGQRREKTKSREGGGAGWKIGLPSHGGSVVCLQGKVTGGNGSNEV